MQRLPRLLGRPVAMEMMLAGRALDASEAKALGYAYAVTPVDKTLDESIALARRMADHLGPAAMAVFKSRMAQARNETFQEALANDQAAFDGLFGTPAFEEAFRKFQERMSEQ